VYSVFLLGDRHDGFSTVFTKSTDHGATWTTPVHVYGNVSWTDKPEVTMSSDGKDVYVSWNGPQGGDLYVGVSHDYGATWTQQQLPSDKRYYYAYDGRVLSDDRTVIFSESSLVYNGLKNVDDAGGIWHHAIISRDKGATWENVIVAKVQNGEACVAAGSGRTSTPVRPPSSRTRPAISCSRTKAQRRPGARSASTSRDPPTAATRGAPARRFP
jgi:hypothetical protein